jgi:AcrR family transcriptional regulator
LATHKAKRPRNAAATREAILHSALTAFSRHGYDGIGVREIAQSAGVNAVLVCRYFGCKEDLFAAAVELAFANSSLFEGDCNLLAQRFANDLIVKTDRGVEPTDPLLLLLRSAPNPRAAEILRESIARRFEGPLQALLPGPNASKRAATILALMIGFSLYRKVLRSKALADGCGASLCSDLTRMFQCLIDSPATPISPIRASRAKRSAS